MATIQTEDVLPVRSRVSWGAIFAGTVVALASYLLLSVLGVALGLSFSAQLGERELGIGATAWAVVTTLLSLFLGGCIASLCTVGENKGEAVIYGIIVWGTVFAMLLWLMASGIRVGFNALIGIASTPVAQQFAQQASALSDADLRAAGFTDEQITNFRNQFEQLRNRSQNLPQQMRQAAEDPRATAAAWWTFGGLFLSMLAAVGGALAGSGPTLHLAAVRMRSTVLGTRVEPREPVNR
jgi:ABC-type transport system involved in multi-copper enzyme maturation permease subunit